MMVTPLVPTKRRLPKLMSCMTKTSVDNYRNHLLFNLSFFDAKRIRRQKLPFHECVLLELQEAGFTESFKFLKDLFYDNQQLIEEDHIGTTVDIRKRADYLEYLRRYFEIAEQAHEKGQVNKESVVMLKLAMYFMDREKGVLWLADKLYLAAIAVASQYQLDGGRQKSRCKYYFAKFLLDKFPELGPDSAYDILTMVRDECNGKPWLLYDSKEDDVDVEPAHDENEHDGNDHPEVTIFVVVAMQLFRILCDKVRDFRKTDPLKAERMARLALRRAADGGDKEVFAKALIELGLCQFAANNFKTSLASFERANAIYEELKNMKGICEAKMHLAAVLQRLGQYESAAKLLTVMGATAMEHNLRWELGRALHLLGELHLRSNHPDLGTHHLSEAFVCFMGFRVQSMPPEQLSSGSSKSDSTNMRNTTGVFDVDSEIYINEAEQSRLMMAISAGQEVMASFFSLLHDAKDCTIAKVKTVEWKLSNRSWMIRRKYHNYIPCPCPRHNRTALDALWLMLAAVSVSLPSTSSHWSVLNRQDAAQDITLVESVGRLDCGLDSSDKPLAS